MGFRAMPTFGLKSWTWINREPGLEFTDREPFGDFELNVPGRHNVSNALACMVIANYAGLSIAQIQAALRIFQGARRRFQIVGSCNGAIIVDDYAHHPTEVAAMIQAAQEGWPKRQIVAVFQPHRYSRTKLLFEEFSRSFQEADVVIITDIFAPPPEQPIAGVSSSLLAERIRDLKGPQKVYHIPKQEDVVPFLKGWLSAEDLVLVMGAGPIWRVAKDLV